MNTQRFLISTKTDGRSQSLPWDSGEPLIIGKTISNGGWLLETTEKGDLRVRSLGTDESKPTKAYSKVIPLHQAKKGVEMKFAGESGAPLEVKIHEIEALRVSDFRKKEGIDLHSGFIVYSTIGDWTTQMSSHRREYRAYWMKQEIFRVLVTQNGVRLLAKKPGVRFEADSKWLEVREDSERVLSEADLIKTSITWGNHQWHFTGLVETVKDPIFDQRKGTDDEHDFQRATGLSLLMLLLFFFGGKFLSPLKSLEEKPLPVQLVKILKKKTNVVKAQKKLEMPGEKKPEEQKVAARAEEPVPEKVAPAPEQVVVPKGNPAPSAPVAQAQPPKGQPEKFKTRTTKAPTKNRITNLASGGFLGGLQKMLNSDQVLKTAKSGHEGKFRGDAKSFTSAISGIQMNLANVGSGSVDSKVQGFGGKEGAAARGPASVGYGDGSKAGVMSGTGASQIVLGVKDAEIDEGLTRDEVGRVIHAHMKEVRYCYESSMVRAPASKVEGSVALAFTIVATGKVTKSSVAQSSVPDSALGECIRKRLDSWQFPKPKGGVNVNITYPFIFNTLGGG
jgi:TonB family protein